jgi:hypothetical protein
VTDQQIAVARRGILQPIVEHDARIVVDALGLVAWAGHGAQGLSGGVAGLDVNRLSVHTARLIPAQVFRRVRDGIG